MFAEAVCGARQSCNCSDARFATTQDCEADLRAEFAMTAAIQGLTLDSDCLKSIIDSEVISECPPGPWFDTCVVLQGMKIEGAACDPHFELMPFPVNECKDGLICIGGFCESPGAIVADFAVGDPCVKDIGCTSTQLYCGEDGRCHPILAAGEECNHYLACEFGYFCKGLGETQGGVCSPRAAPGATCSPKDWKPCLDAGSESTYWCNSDTSTCVEGEPGICLMTHPVALIDE